LTLATVKRVRQRDNSCHLARLTREGYGAGNLGRGGDGSVVVGHFDENALCGIAGD
jgi:hypothetical protein